MGLEAAVIAAIVGGLKIAAGVIAVGAAIAIGTVGIVEAVNAGRRNNDYYKRLNAMLDASPTYGYGSLMTQTNNCLSVPIVYGEVKVAGNTIWQDGSDSNNVSKVISFGTGEIESIYDIKINDNLISSYQNCSYAAYTGKMDQLIDSKVPGATQEAKVDLVGGLKGIAYIAVKATASPQLSAMFNLTAKVKGQKVKVYSDLQNYEIKYSNNPAWCILDFLTNYNGCGLDISELDLQSFIESAQYCDQLINNRPRFTLNLVIDERRPRLDWLENMLMTCRGYIVHQGGKISIQIEKPEVVSQVFTPDNILAGSENFWTTPREKRVDIFKVQYIDPENEYAKIYAIAEAEEFENEQPIIQEARVFGVTNFNQASRLAWFYLNQAKTCNKFIAFKTSQEGLDRTVGDVIEVTSTFLGYENKKMRIVNISEAQEGQIGIACKEYNPTLYSDQLGSAAPIVNAIALPNVFEAPPAPESLMLDEIGWRTPEGVHISNIQVSYPEINYIHLSHYEISYSKDNGLTWEQGKKSYDGSYTISNVQIGEEYTVRVQSVNNRNILSEFIEATITIEGKNNPPQAVKEFIVIQKGNLLKAVVVPPDDPDIDHYEIRKGLFWGDSEFVCEFSGKEVMFRPTEIGTLNYLIKAVDTVGNYSEAAVRAAVNVSGLTPKNIIIDETFNSNEFLDGGILNQGAISDEIVKLMPVMDMGVNFEDYRLPRETILTVDLEGNTNCINVEYRCGYAKFNGWDYLTWDEDNWEGEIEAHDWEDFRVNPELYNDLNLIQWSDWKSVKHEPVFCAQYLQVRIYARCYRGNVSDISNIHVIADIEDIEDTIFNIDLPAQKTTLDLNKNFTLPPAIISTTADETGKTCAWRVSNITKHRFDIELLDKDDNLIAGKLLQATARGY